VVAYAIAGTVLRDLMTEPVGQGTGGATCAWATSGRPATRSTRCCKHAMNGKAYRENYDKVASEPGKLWKDIAGVKRQVYTGRARPTSRAAVLRRLRAGAAGRRRVRRARRARDGAVRRLDHHRPHLAGRLDQGGLAGRQWLKEHGVLKADFNSYGSRRGNHEVMMRGTFANVRIKNLMIPPRPTAAARKAA
jgi:aconitate hydratase